MREWLRLKSIERTGWLRAGVKRGESVAAHSWGMSILAMHLCPPSLDKTKVLEMAIIHDLPEIIVGDLTPGDDTSTKAADEMKAMACNTLYTFNAEEENNPDLLYSFWPKPGRQIVFDSRIPYLIRTPENGKTSLRLVFKGTNKDYIPETTGDEIVFTEVE